MLVTDLATPYLVPAFLFSMYIITLALHRH